MVRQGHFAGTRQATATHEADTADRVVRGPEGSRPEKTGFAQETRGAVDAGHLDRLIEHKGRQDSGQPPREHGLAAAGRSDHEQVVTAGGRHLQGSLGVRLPLHLREIESYARRFRPVGGGFRTLRPSLPSHRGGRVEQPLDAVHSRSRDRQRLVAVPERDDELMDAAASRQERRGEAAGHPADRAVECQLSENEGVGEPLGR